MQRRLKPLKPVPFPQSEKAQAGAVACRWQNWIAKVDAEIAAVEHAGRGLTSTRFKRGGSRVDSDAVRACAREPHASTAARPAASKDGTTVIRSHRPSVLEVAVLHGRPGRTRS